MMSYLRLVHSAPRESSPDSACLSAFDAELDYLFATLHRLGAAPSEVEDLAQEVFVVLHRQWSTLDLSRPIRPYLFGIAFRIVCAHRRRLGRETPHAEVEITDHGETPEGVLQNKQATALVQAALAKVPLSRRAVVILHDLDEVPIVEIAQTMSMTRFGAYTRLRKGRKELAAAVRQLLRGGDQT